MSATDDRNARLDALAAAVTTWADKQTSTLENTVATAKAILQGRTGAERLASSTAQAAQDGVVNSINDFLTG